MSGVCRYYGGCTTRSRSEGIGDAMGKESGDQVRGDQRSMRHKVSTNILVTRQVQGRGMTSGITPEPSEGDVDRSLREGDEGWTGGPRRKGTHL